MERYTRNPAMLRKLVNELLAVQPAGPKFLMGYSRRGLMAFDMARMLLSQGQEVALVALMDTRTPGYRRRARRAYYIGRIWHHLYQARHFASKAALKYLRAKTGIAWAILRKEIGASLMPLATAPGDAWTRLSRYPGRVVMLRAMIRGQGEDKYYRPLMGWERLVTNGD